jgi:DNA-binding NtrC family response regulator
MHESRTDRDTILLVQHEVLIRTSLAQFLRECGYRVVEAGSVAEARAFMENSTVEVSVVFSTVQFPGGTEGFDLAHWVRAHRPGVQVILAGSINAAAQKAEKLCAAAMETPYRADDVARRIRRLLAARRSGIDGIPTEPDGATQEQ